MLTDTHAHLAYLDERGEDVAAILKEAHESGFRLIIDAGTQCNDLPERMERVKAFTRKASDSETVQAEISRMVRFTAGIWPGADAIKDRFSQIKILDENIDKAFKDGVPPCALGECGLDHHWNPSGVDNRSQEDFTQEILEGEKELFALQIEMARKYRLPVMVHSRDAFQGTFDVIKECGYDKGEIHCYSYGLDEARAFLDRGWYIALGGAVTYTKKSRMEEMKALINYIPEDMLLLETDAPYLAPVPMRGTVNTPLLVKHTYEFIASVRGVSLERLADSVYRNSLSLFTLE